MAKLLMRKNSKFLEALVNGQGDLIPTREINPEELSHFGTERYFRIFSNKNIFEDAAELKKEYYNGALQNAIGSGAHYAYVTSPSPEKGRIPEEVVFNGILTLYVTNHNSDESDI